MNLATAGRDTVRQFDLNHKVILSLSPYIDGEHFNLRDVHASRASGSSQETS
jgi:hypothetical protein